MNAHHLLTSTILAVLLCPVPAGAQSLSEAMTHAYLNNPELASARLDIQAAKQAADGARAGLLPTIAVNAGISENWTSAPPPGSSNEWSTASSVGLNYSQTLFDSFATNAAVDAALARRDAVRHGATNIEQNVLLNVATAHFNVVADRRVVAFRAENLDFLRAQLAAVRDRVSVGDATALAVAQAEAALAQAEAEYQAAVNRLRTGEANYERWAGMPPARLSTDITLRHMIPGSLEAALDAALARHPGLLATQAGIRAAQFQAEEARSRFGPELSISASAGVSDLTSDSWTQSASFGLNLSVPIFVPSRSSSIEQANIGRIQADLEAFTTRDIIVEAVRQAWSGMTGAASQIQAATAAVAANRVALRAVMDRSEVGESTTLDVLDAQSTRLAAEEALVNAQAQQSIATFALLSATGQLTGAGLGFDAAQATQRSVAREQGPQGTPVAPADPWSGLR